ncbi:Protein-L-isoaspartate(D-aspartate) O-methyltransferase, partial [Fragariocoptes setiger]
CSGKSLKELINNLKNKGVIQSERVEDCMRRVDRANYCNSPECAYDDKPLPIGTGATISAPHMHAYALESLEKHLTDGAKVLDIGSGSGYLTACMALMVGPNGKVFGLEHIPELVERSKKNLNKDQPSLISSGRVEILLRDGRNGLPEEAPFDAIHVGAAAPELPTKLIEQLKIGGRLVTPVMMPTILDTRNQSFQIIDKTKDGIRRQHAMDVSYVPLTSSELQIKKN